jgi:hypothetical protein
MQSLIHVPFHDDQVQAVQQDRDVWCVVKRLCENLGLDVQAQQRRLQRQPWAGTAIMAVPSPGGLQPTFCLHLKSLAMWLATIEASRVKPEIRPKLIAYQKDCADVLYRRFFEGEGQTSMRELLREVTRTREEVKELTRRVPRPGGDEDSDEVPADLSAAGRRGFEAVMRFRAKNLMKQNQKPASPMPLAQRDALAAEKAARKQEHRALLEERRNVAALQALVKQPADAPLTSRQAVLLTGHKSVCAKMRRLGIGPVGMTPGGYQMWRRADCERAAGRGAK